VIVCRRLKGWLRLGWNERLLLPGLAVLLTTIHVLIALFGYAPTRRWLERFSHNPRPRPSRSHELNAARRLAEMAAIAGRNGLVDATCLRQSLMVYYLLRRKGLAPSLKIGVRTDDGRLDAHAWVELDGVPLDKRIPTHAALPEASLQRGGA